MTDDRLPAGFPIFLNGRFLGRPVTGVERFAGGILHALDAMLSEAEAARCTVLVPPDVAVEQGFRRLRVSRCGHFAGHAWEQINLAAASADGILVSLCNSGPVLHRRHLVVVHDALVYRFPAGFSTPYRLLHRTLGRALALSANLATVSAFSRGEIAAVLGVPEARIGIVPNAVDHLDRIEADPSVLERLQLQGRRFLLFVGSPAPNKNLRRAVEAFETLGRDDVTFVMVGAAARSFSQGLGGDLPSNCLHTGRLTDGEIKMLYTAATALVFPSLYEGFGIPPIEAMRLGCPVIASDIPVVREVCADAARYFDPMDTAAMAGAMQDVLADETGRLTMRRAGEVQAARFSWTRSAEELLRILVELFEHR